jgi:two-component system sensor histidine kinase/response regulator
MNRDVIGAFLRAAGLEVVTAENGQDAVRIAAEQNFELILMDVRMPEMDGLEATRRIRVLPAPHGQVPILALTAYCFPDQVRECRAAGMNGHVAKPVDYETLMRAVAGAIALWPPVWTTDRAPEAGAEPDPVAPPTLDRRVLDQLLAFLPPDEVAANLRSLRAREEQMLQLMESGEDATADPAATRAALTDAAHALASTAGMFGLTALSVAARRFEHATDAEAPECAVLARQVYDEVHAALALLNTLTREGRMQTV